jgi:hypothetical protein
MSNQGRAPRGGQQGSPDSTDTLLVVVDGPEDTTHRPRLPDHPLHPPGRQSPPKRPPQVKPPTDNP